MNPIKTPTLQRGALLIVAVVLVLVIAVLVLSMSFMATSNIGISGGYVSSAQALYIAESGIESALYRLHQPGLGCISGASGVGETQTVGQGSYTTVATTFNPAGHTVASAITAADTIIPVTAPITDFAPHGRVLIGSEEIDYSDTSTSVAVCGTAPCLTGAVRGAAGTAAAVHLTGISVNQNLCLIRSTGTVGPAVRVVEKAVHTPMAMVVYAQGAAVNTPFFRFWDSLNATWDIEQTATPVGAGNTITFVVLRLARTRNEATLATVDSSGEIRAQFWNGFTWSTTTQQLSDVGGAGDANFRGIDVAYERTSDRAIIAYDNGINANPDYRIWDGSALSAAVSTGTGAGGGVSFVRWIDLAANPLASSNEIAMIVLQTNGGLGTRAVRGMQWDGAAWSNMGAGAGAWAVPTDGLARHAVAVAYEQLSGQAMFAWGNNTTDNNSFRTWDGSTTTLSAINTANLDIANQNGISQWVRLASQPNSNNLLFGTQDAGADLNTRFWDGAAWDTAATHPEHDPATENVQSRNFDLVFETHPANPGDAWLVWGNGFNMSRRQWTGAWGGVANASDDAALVQLNAQPGSGSVFSFNYQDQSSIPDHIRESHLTNGGLVWSGEQPIWGGQTVAQPVNERVSVQSRRVIEIDHIEIYP